MRLLRKKVAKEGYLEKPGLIAKMCYFCIEVTLKPGDLVSGVSLDHRVDRVANILDTGICCSSGIYL